MDTNLLLSDIICAVNLNPVQTEIITIISFMLYKQWLIFREAGISRNINNCTRFLTAELYTRVKLYEHTNNITLQEPLKNLLNNTHIMYAV